MNKPNNYDNTKVGGDFTPVELGGHHMVIKQVSERKNKSGGDMIVVLFDFAKGDRQEGYFTDQFKNDIRPDKKWPHNGSSYINVNDAKTGECSRSFKSFITSVEKSNRGFVVQWGDNFCQQFKNKKIGGVFGEVENEWNGKTSMRHELRWLGEDGKMDSAKIPDPKYLPTDGKKGKAVTGKEDFMNVPDSEDESIPF